MSKTLDCSHIFVVSEDRTIVDLGEYGYSKLHISNNYAKEINGDNFRGTFQIEGIPENATTLVIEHPSTKTKQLFISADYKIPIDHIFSRTNRNGDCIIYGTIRSKPPVILCAFGSLSGYEITVVEPYFLENVAQRMFKEVEVHNWCISRGARYNESQEEATQAIIKRPLEQLREKGEGQGKGTTKPLRPNPIVERMKQIIL